MRLRGTCWAACLLLVAGAADARPETWARPLDEPSLPNLHQVTPSIFRSAQPEEGAHEALQRLGVRSVISLRFRGDRAALLPGVRRIHAPIESWDVDHDEVMRALRALVDPDNQPVLLHCRHGADRTGTVIAAYRMVVEGWSAEEAIEEMREGGYNYHAIWRNMVRYLRRLDVAAARSELGISPGSGDAARGTGAARESDR